MRLRELSCGALLLALVIQSGELPSAGSAGGPRVSGLSATLSEDRSRAAVDFRIENGLSEDTLERIHSGISITLRYRVRMMMKRDLPLMPRNEVARTRIHATASYDSLTGQYRLNRVIEIKARKKKDKPAPAEMSMVTTSVDEMKTWMTVFENVPLYDPIRSFDENPLRVKLDSDLGRRYVMWIFPATVDASADFDLEP